MFESTITLNHVILDAITIKSIFEISGLLWSPRMLSMLRLMRFYFLNSKFFRFIFTIGLNIQYNILIYIFSKKLQIDHCVMLEWTSYNFGKLRKYLLPLLHILCIPSSSSSQVVQHLLLLPHVLLNGVSV